MPRNSFLLTVLSFDRFVGKQLTVFERMLIHQNLNQYRPLGHELLFKVIEIDKKIYALNWKPPKYRYNQDRMIEIYNEDLNHWQIFKNENRT